jgi:thioredoxin 1
MAQELSESNFDDVVGKSEKPVLVDFYATWCGPCVQQTPILEKWAQANESKVTVAKLNVDEAQQLASKFGVMSIPTLIIFKGGKEKVRAMGLQNDRGLDALLAKAGA